MAADLPEEFDVVILGTGLPESIVASACSRIGRRVLHLDVRNYYGGNWASFTFSGLQAWIEANKERAADPDPPVTSQEDIQENEGIIRLTQRDRTIRNIEVFSYSRNEDPEPAEESGVLSVKQELLAADQSDAPAADQSDAPAADQSDAPAADQSDAPAADQSDAPAADQSDAPAADQSEAKSQEEPENEAADRQDAGESEVSESGDAPKAEPNGGKASQREERVRLADVVREGRRFNIDLVSKLLYSRGLLIDLLIKSSVSRYTEFKNVTRILTYHHGKIQQVPCSRADVFSSKQLSMIEKRTLMKFLTFCADYEQHPEEYQDYKDSTFVEFLQSKRLTPGLQHFVLCSIAMVPRDVGAVDGLKATRYFLRSLGRYGNTPFLFHMYGLGEIPQCFCRMSAVFGGLYCLHHSLQCLVIDEQSQLCKAVIDSRGKRIRCSHVLVEDGYLSPETCAHIQYKQISRAVLITDRSVLKSPSDQEISVLTVSSEDGQHNVHVTELCSSTNTCMKNTYLVHVWCPSVKDTAREDLESTLKELFTLDEEEDPEDAEKPLALWLLYFNMRDSSAVERESYLGLPSNVFVCGGPDSAVGYDRAVQQAEKIFSAMFPSEEFCPAAPSPEDIIYDSEPQPQQVAPESDPTNELEPKTSPEMEAEPAGDSEEVKSE
ncbi:rab proteins geranylgeranyltransferase component A 1 [Gastrophryne carolinensis]